MLDYFPYDVMEDEIRHLPLSFTSPTLRSLVTSPSFSTSLAPHLPPLSLTPSSTTAREADAGTLGDESTYFRFQDNISVDEVSHSSTGSEAAAIEQFSPVVSSMKDPFTSSIKKATLNHSSDFEMSYLRGEASCPSSPSPAMLEGMYSYSSEGSSSPKRRRISLMDLNAPIPTNVPEPYNQIGFCITTYRWKAIDDCDKDVPIVEIRPYNKSDGKRYVYIRVDGIDRVNRLCIQKDLPICKAKFRVEKCCDNSVLGSLLMRDGTERSEEDRHYSVDYSGSGTRGVSSLHTSDSSGYSDDEDQDELVDLSSHLTLLVTERIVQQLDNDCIGKGSPPPIEHQLRIVISLVIEDVDDMGNPMDKEFQHAVLPFYRIKRRQKRRPSRPTGSRKHNRDSSMKPGSIASTRGSRTKAPKSSNSKSYHDDDVFNPAMDDL